MAVIVAVEEADRLAMTVIGISSAIFLSAFKYYLLELANQLAKQFS